MALRPRNPQNASPFVQVSRGDLLVIAHAFVRRDFFVFIFLIYALAGVPFLALVHASLLAAGQLVLASSQFVWRLTRKSA